MRKTEGRERLRSRVNYWSMRLKVRPRVLRIQRMTSKWGSCSAKGVVTIAADLVRQSPGFQDFVIAHELLHLKVPNHGKVFKALMNAHLPGWRRFDAVR